DRARGARLVDDDDVGTQRLLEFGGHHPCHLVGGTTGCPRHDDVDGAVRLPRVITLRERGGGGERQCCHEGNGSAEGSVHGVAPFSLVLLEVGGYHKSFVPGTPMTLATRW